MEATIIATNKCNLRCKHCLRSNYDEDDLPVETLEKFLLQFSKRYEDRFFSLTGGEPTLHSNLTGVLDLLRLLKFKGTIVTNGQYKKGIEELCFNKDVFWNVVVSIEGSDAKTNDHVRGKGSFEKLLSSIEMMRKSGLPVHTRTVIGKHNYKDIAGMFEFARKYGVSMVTFSTVQPNTHSRDNGLLASEDDLYRALADYQTILNGKAYPDIHSFFNTRHFIQDMCPEWGINCNVFLKKTQQIAILPSGQVSICCDLPNFFLDHSRYTEDNKVKFDHILGDINIDSLSKIVSNRSDLFEKLCQRRREDAENGKLTGARSFFCENCKYYFC